MLQPKNVVRAKLNQMPLNETGILTGNGHTKLCLSLWVANGD